MSEMATIGILSVIVLVVVALFMAAVFHRPNEAERIRRAQAGKLSHDRIRQRIVSLPTRQPDDAA